MRNKKVAVDTLPNANTSVVEAQLMVVETRDNESVVVAAKTWFEVEPIVRKHAFMEMVIDVVEPTALIPVLTQLEDDVHVWLAAVS